MTHQSIFTKPFNDISYSDIMFLKEKEIPESNILEYKTKYTKRLPQIINSFANANGGYIILGIKERKSNNKNTGKPEEIIGVDKEDHETRITTITISHSQPIISPDVRSIEIPDTDKEIVIIKIKESFEPIMETSSKRFYIRINDQSLPADYSLVKKLFNKENYIIEKRVKRLFRIIKERLENLEVVSYKKRGGYLDYFFKLKGIEMESDYFSDILNRNYTEFKDILLAFKKDLKYFGSKKINPLSFMSGKYIITNRYISCPLIFNIELENLLPFLLSDLKKYCKEYFTIDLD